ncbi:hypothetical protein ACFLUH_02255 [Chloroflexota bacterium]
MYMLQAIKNWGWCPILITVLVIAGYSYEWSAGNVAILIVIILVIGLITGMIRTREKDLEHASLKLRQLSGYFVRRFTGNSSLSIFAMIDTLFKVDNPKLWDWARACDMSQRIFDTWCSGFTGRVETDIRTRGFVVYLHTYLNELWLINSHYYEFVEQFYEIAASMEIPPETAAQYSRFVTEYNTYVQEFRDVISELKQIARTGVEPPSVKFARELATVK